MANISGYRPLANPEWISLAFDDGSSMAVHDPSGEYRAQVDEIAKKIAGVPPDPMANATASLGGELAQGAGAAMARDVPAPLATPPRVDATFSPSAPSAAARPAEQGAAAGATRILAKYAMKPQPESTMPDGDGAAPQRPGTTPAPVPPPMGVGAPSLVTTDTTSSWQRTKNEQRQSTGISEEDRPKVEAANEASVKATEEANRADFAARANQLWSEWGRLSEQEKRKIAERGALQEQERRYDEALNSAYRKYDEDAARPIDPSKAFAGEKGWYAFMAGFGDVLRNVGSALAGKGPVADPGATLDALVERSVNLQMAQKEQDLKAGRISIDRYTADRETTRHRLGLVLSQLAQNELQKAQTQQGYQALGAMKAKGDAIVADARAKGAAALARQETVGTSTSQVSGGTMQKGIVPSAGADGIGAMSKLIDIEKKRIELENAQLDRVDAQEASRIVGSNISPQRLEKLRASLKENAPQMAKLDSFFSALQKQLEINGATLDRNTGEVKWPSDLSGVSAIRWTDIPVPFGENITTDASRLDAQRAFLKELVTTDTTGAVADLAQKPVFEQVAGGAVHNEKQYKESVENLAKYMVERRNGLLAPLGEDGIRLYRHNEQLARKGLAPSATPIGTLPEGRR